MAPCWLVTLFEYCHGQKGEERLCRSGVEARLPWALLALRVLEPESVALGKEFEGPEGALGWLSMEVEGPFHPSTRDTSLSVSEPAFFEILD